jgi:hypothetical protein
VPPLAGLFRLSYGFPAPRAGLRCVAPARGSRREKSGLVSAVLCKEFKFQQGELQVTWCKRLECRTLTAKLPSVTCFSWRALKRIRTEREN